jgi:hypothetical protein
MALEQDPAAAGPAEKELSERQRLFWISEASWLGTAELHPIARFNHHLALLGHVQYIEGAARTKAGRRKLRLVGCGACRQVWHLLKNKRSRAAVEVAELFADGLVDGKRLAVAEAATQRYGVRYDPVACAAVWTASPKALEAAEYPLKELTLTHFQSDTACDLIRDVFGNPHRPLPARRFPAHVVGLAEACYGAFPAVSGDFLILSDALDELGEEQAAAHCREPLHVRGCHVLDWVCGR